MNKSIEAIANRLAAYNLDNNEAKFQAARENNTGNNPCVISRDSIF
jgi:hypothetical protein